MFTILVLCGSIFGLLAIFYHFCSLKTAVRAQMSDFLTANVSGSVPPPHPQEQNFSGVPNFRIMIEKIKEENKTEMVSYICPIFRFATQTFNGG